MELKVWIGSVQRIISGVSLHTTSQDVIVALAQATGKTGRFTLIEKWREYEKTLAPNDCPLANVQKFGDYAHEVHFILRQTGEITTTNRRLAEAKSPKPQRRRGGLKKSLSFSGGPQSNSPSLKPSASVHHSTIVEEEIGTANHQAQSKDSPYGPSEPSTSHSFRPIRKPEDHVSVHPTDQHSSHQKVGRQKGQGHGLEGYEQYRFPDGLVDKQQQKHGRSAHHKRRLTATVAHRDTSSSEENSESRSARKDSRRVQDRRMEELAAAEQEERIREGLELQQTLTNHEKKLDEERRKLCNLEKDISTVTSEEEWKWGQLYDCRDDIGKALQTVQHLEIELDECDEVLLSEELHVLRLKRQEMEEDMSELRLKLSDCSSELETKTKESTSLRNQIDGIEKDNRSIEQQIVEREDEINKLQSRVAEKKRFLTEAETGYLSACDDLKEADNALERRKRMLMNLERELREYSLKSFINTGFNEKDSEKPPKDVKSKPGRIPLQLVNSSGLYV